jgi:hypothetical protein
MDSIAFSMAESGTLEILRSDNTNFWEIFARMYDLRRTDLERQNKKPMLPINRLREYLKFVLYC